MASSTEHEITLDMLREIGLFGGLSPASLERLRGALPVVRAEPGESLVSEGALSTEMFVVLSGELEVVKRAPDGSQVRVALLGPRDWFGEMSILDVQPRSASVRCLSPSVLLGMGPEHADQLLYREDVKEYALFVMNIARELSRRLRVADGILAQFFVAVHEQYARSPSRT